MKLNARITDFLCKRLAGRHTLRSVLDNSFWLFCDQILRMGTGLLVGVWMARYLGPERFGWLNYALATVGVVGAFTSFGLNSVVVRELVRTPSDMNSYAGAAFFLRGIGAALGYLACIGVAYLNAVPSDEVRLLILIVAGGMFFQVFDVFDLLFQASGAARISAWVRMAACLLTTTIKVVLLLCHASVAWLALAGVAEIFLTAAGWWWAARRKGWRIADWNCERNRVFTLLNQSWPLAVATVAITVQAYADQLVIGFMLGGNELGQYSVAIRLISIFGFLPILITTVVAPEITRAKRDDELLYLRRMHTIYRLMFGLFLITALPLVLFGSLLVKTLYGASFAGAAALLPILAARLFLTNFGVARSLFLTNEGLLRFALMTAVAGGVTNIILNLMLVPHWGVNGAIFSSLASFFVTTFALEMFHPRARVNFRLMASAVFLPWRPFNG